MDELAVLEALGPAACDELSVVPTGHGSPADAAVADAGLDELVALAQRPAQRQRHYRLGSWDVGLHMVDVRMLEQRSA